MFLIKLLFIAFDFFGIRNVIRIWLNPLRNEAISEAQLLPGESGKVCQSHFSYKAETLGKLGKCQEDQLV